MLPSLSVRLLTGEPGYASSGQPVSTLYKSSETVTRVKNGGNEYSDGNVNPRGVVIGCTVSFGCCGRVPVGEVAADDIVGAVLGTEAAIWRVERQLTGHQLSHSYSKTTTVESHFSKTTLGGTNMSSGSALGGRTKAFKSYGKRKINVTNQSSKLFWVDSSPEPATKLNAQPVHKATEAAQSLNTDAHVTRWSDDSDSDGSSVSDTTELKSDRRKTAPMLKKYGSSRGRRHLLQPSATRDKENAQHVVQLPGTKAYSEARQMVPPASQSKAAKKFSPQRPRSAFAVVVQQPTLRSEGRTSTSHAQRLPSRKKTKSTLDRFVEVTAASAEADHPKKSYSAKPKVSVNHGTKKLERSMVSDDASIDASKAVRRQPKRRTTTKQASISEDELVELEIQQPQLMDSILSTASSSDGSTLEPNLADLLELCASPCVIDFAHFISSPPAPFSSSSPVRWRKIGEASYSEVFEAQNTVVKIIPVATESSVAALDSETDLPYLSDGDLVRREIVVSALCGGPNARVGGFVGFKGAFLVRGKYPAALLRQWDSFKRRYPDSEEQIRPDVLPADQVFAVICLENAGVSLEDFRVKTWQQAASILWQVARICADAEREYEFEHRDLHWGNVLLRDTPLESVINKLTLAEDAVTDPYTAAQTGVEAVLIDFTLSRARLDSKEVVYDPFDDECIFEGEGDYQYDVYRSMKQHVKGQWARYHPKTNVMWLHYLARKLIKDKNLKRPKKDSMKSTNPGARAEMRAYKDLIQAESILHQAILDTEPLIGSAQDVWTYLRDMCRREKS
ncbi:hypothetical protein OIV83_000712 [Microbotryomycetes sp. JL201]|nr:hypothetical protein OIV83_000712 [Microbotryomycetes sp. JL201]